MIKTILCFLLAVAASTAASAEDGLGSLSGEYSNAMPGYDFLYLHVHANGTATYSNHNGVITGPLTRIATERAKPLYTMAGKTEHLLDHWTYGFEFDSPTTGFHLVGMGRTLDDLLKNIGKYEREAFGEYGRARVFYRDWLSPVGVLKKTQPADVGSALHGSYSNFKESFRGVGITICSNEFAVLHFSFGGLSGEWTYQEHQGRDLLVMTAFDSEAGKDLICLFDANLTRNTLHWLAITNTLENALAQMETARTVKSGISDNGPFYLVTNAVPEKFIEAKETFPQRKAQVKAQREYHRHEKETREERNRLVEEIRKNPKNILTIPLPITTVQTNAVRREPVEVGAIRDALSVLRDDLKDDLVLSFADRPEVRTTYYYVLQFCIQNRNDLTIETKTTLLGIFLEALSSAKTGDIEELLGKLSFPPDMLRKLLDANTLPQNVLDALRTHLSEKH